MHIYNHIDKSFPIYFDAGFSKNEVDIETYMLIIDINY